MKLGIIISSNDSETVWNAFRFGNFALGQKDEVQVFLLAKGVEAEQIGTAQFDVKQQMEKFLSDGGEILACGTCLKIRNTGGSELCPISTMADLYEVVKRSDKVVSF